MQANPGLQQTNSRSLTVALLVVMAAAALLLGGAGGYWARGFNSAPSISSPATHPATGVGATTSAAANTAARQRLIDANQDSDSLPALVQANPAAAANEKARQRLIGANSDGGSQSAQTAVPQGAPTGDW